MYPGGTILAGPQARAEEQWGEQVQTGDTVRKESLVVDISPGGIGAQSSEKDQTVSPEASVRQG